jgi:hypothetical protein
MSYYKPGISTMDLSHIGDYEEYEFRGRTLIQLGVSRSILLRNIGEMLLNYGAL